MKVFTTLALTVAIAGTALSVNANPQQHRGLELCKAEIQDTYGVETELMLVDTRRDLSGTSMRIAARIDADNSRFVSCWVPRQESGGGYVRDGAGLAANLAEPVQQ